MSATGVGRDYPFANLPFRARETITFDPNERFQVPAFGRGVSVKNLDELLQGALSWPGGMTNFLAHFFLAHLCGKMANKFLLKKSSPRPAASLRFDILVYLANASGAGRVESRDRTLNTRKMPPREVQEMTLKIFQN